MRWTEEQYSAYLKTRIAQKNTAEQEPTVLALPIPSVHAPYRSQLEARYAQHLALLQQMGAITQWWYEPMRLKLAPRTTYTPDFLVLIPGQNLPTFHETKGWRRDDAMVKLKVAARLYAPLYTFTLVTWDRQAGQWRQQDIPS